MKRPQLNLLIDLLAATCFVGMIATGYIIHFPLPPGSNKSLVLWRLSRHEWGEVHFWISVGLLALLLVHIALHWQWIVSVLARQLHVATDAHRSHVRGGILAVVIAAASLGAFAWLASVSVTERIDACCPPANEAVSEPAAAPSDSRPSDTHTNAVDFSRDVYPVLERSCLSCHGPTRVRGNFRIDRREDYFDENNGRQIVVAHDSAKSELIAIVPGLRPEMKMGERHRLLDEEVGVLRSWIDAGAEWPENRDAN